jgi:hypothetical protein
MEGGNDRETTVFGDPAAGDSGNVIVAVYEFGFSCGHPSLEALNDAFGVPLGIGLTSHGAEDLGVQTPDQRGKNCISANESNVPAIGGEGGAQQVHVRGNAARVAPERAYDANFMLSVDR